MTGMISNPETDYDTRSNLSVEDLGRALAKAREVADGIEDPVKRARFFRETLGKLMAGSLIDEDARNVVQGQLVMEKLTDEEIRQYLGRVQ